MILFKVKSGENPLYFYAENYLHIDKLGIQYI